MNPFPWRVKAKVRESRLQSKYFCKKVHRDPPLYLHFCLVTTLSTSLFFQKCSSDSAVSSYDPPKCNKLLFRRKQLKKVASFSVLIFEIMLNWRIGMNLKDMKNNIKAENSTIQKNHSQINPALSIWYSCLAFSCTICTPGIIIFALSALGRQEKTSVPFCTVQ